MRVYFVKDNVETQINDDSIMALSYSASLFSDTFKLGSTLCRAFDLDVLKSAVANQPDYVLLKKQVGSSWVTYATLIVDELNEDNSLVYSYKLCDRMVKGNIKYNAHDIFVSDHTTLGAIVNDICGRMGVTAPSSFYKDDMDIKFYDNTLTARDYLGFVAELQGGYAQISANNGLNFVPFSNNSVDTISLDDCSDFQLGATYLIDRVGFNGGTSAVYYPSTSNNQTVYINPSNVFFEESDLQHIHSIINGFTFSIVKVENCPINDSVQAGNIITIGTTKTIAQINWNYNLTWLGGYELSIDAPFQEETQISGIEDRMKSLKIIIDRNTNTITQVASEVTQNTQDIGQINNNITDINTELDAQEVDYNNKINVVTQNVSTLTQNQNEISASVSSVQTQANNADAILSSYQTKVQINAQEGVKITKNNDSNYVVVTDSGMKIYVNNTKVAEAVSEGFDAQQLVVDSKWAMDTTENGSVFNIWRK